MAKTYACMSPKAAAHEKLAVLIAKTVNGYLGKRMIKVPQLAERTGLNEDSLWRKLRKTDKAFGNWPLEDFILTANGLQMSDNDILLIFGRGQRK